jgi:hypothetical protein
MQYGGFVVSAPPHPKTIGSHMATKIIDFGKNGRVGLIYWR